jgi:hypothetical protein
MAHIERSFVAKEAALSFIEGLEYVNDSSITGITLISEPFEDFVVRFEDEDREEGGAL